LIVRVGLENNIDWRSIAWALEHPGCFSDGQSGDQALLALPEAYNKYFAWVERHLGSQSWLTPAKIEPRLEETQDGYLIDDSFELAADGYEVNAWFRHDWKPLEEQEIRRGLMLLEWTRVDLLESIRNLDEQTMKIKLEGERWDIEGILGHVGLGEWWYLERLGLAFPEDDLPVNVFERLEQVRASLVDHLPGLVGLNQVVGLEGEIWSPRKLLRRALWHEIDHTRHIYKVKADIVKRISSAS
jgi:hypothetical protein